MVVVVRVGRRRRRVVVVQAVVVAALGAGAEVGAAAAQVGAVGAAGARGRGGAGPGGRLEERVLEVRVGLHVARVWRERQRRGARRRPQLLVAARVGRRQVSRVRVGVAERRQGGRAVVAAPLRVRRGALALRALRLRLAALRLAFCAHTATSYPPPPLSPAIGAHSPWSRRFICVASGIYSIDRERRTVDRIPLDFIRLLTMVVDAPDGPARTLARRGGDGVDRLQFGRPNGMDYN